MLGKQILIIEDDLQTQALTRQILEKEGYRTQWAESNMKAQMQLKKNTPDLIILDRRLPDGDGLEFCKWLRSSDTTKHLPVLFLTSKDSTIDKVVGLKVGGDDYLVKPFQTEELLARIEALLRRNPTEEEPVAKTLHIHGITLDLDQHVCTIAQKKVDLWPKEFELLKTFMERPGRLMSKEFLSEKVWGHDFFASSRAIDTAVQRLRNKLLGKGELIETVKGYGYKLEA